MKRKINFRTYKNRKNQTYRLRNYSCKSSSDNIPSKDSNEHQIQNHIYCTGNSNKQQGQSRIADSSEDAADQIISYNKYNTATTNTNIHNGFVHGVLWCLHHSGEPRRKDEKQYRHHRRNCKERYNRSTNHFSEPSLVLFPNVTSHKHRHTHGQSI